MEQDEVLRPPEFPEPIQTVRDRIARVIGDVTIPHRIRVWHPAIERLLADDEHRRESRFWKPIYDTPFQRRRLRILNAVLNATMRMSGVVCSIHVWGLEDMEIRLSFNAAPATFNLSRSRRRQAVALPLTSDAAKLRLAITPQFRPEGRRAIWDETDGLPLEQQLTEIAIELVLASEIYRRSSAMWQYDWAVEQARQRKLAAERAEKERLKEAERLRVERLLREAAAFRQAAEIRHYVETVRQTRTPETGSPEIERWCQWALEQADRLDPFVSGEFLKRFTRPN